MNIIIDRRLKTKDLDWFTLWTVDFELNVHLILNDKDRSKDFSADPRLLCFKENYPQGIGDEYMKSHLFIESEEIHEKYLKDISEIHHNLTHNLNVTNWLFVHIVKDPHKAAEKYLMKCGVNKEKWQMRPNNPAYDHLSQDWDE